MEGRPIFKDVEFISIVAPADPTTVHTVPVTDDHRRRFASRYAAWKERTHARTAAGPPLYLLTVTCPPVLQMSEVMSFNAVGIHTLEQLSSLSDAETNRFMGGVELRQKAKDYIAFMSAKQPIEALRGERDELKREVASLRQQIAVLEERLTKPATAPAKRG